MTALRQWIERHANLIFAMALPFGLFIPLADQTPNWVVMAFLGGMIFFGCAKITLKEIHEVRTSTGLWFYAVRFLVIPALTFGTIKNFDFPLAAAALLILAAPAGMAAPAITAVIKGNVVFTLALTVVSNLMFVIVAPPYLKYLLGQEIPIDAVKLFLNLLCMVIAPLAAFGLIRWHSPKAIEPIEKIGMTSTIILVFLTITAVVAKLRAQLFENPIYVVEGFFWIASIYALAFLVFGWALGKRQPIGIRKAMSVTSGVNNIALAIVLSVLYFPPKVQLLMIVGEVVWILGIPAFSVFTSRVAPKA